LSNGGCEDGGDGGGSGNPPAENNHYPVIKEILLQPVNNGNDSFVCSGTFSDQDGDLSEVDFSWYVNGQYIDGREYGLSGANATANDVLNIVYVEGESTANIKCVVYVFNQGGRSDSAEESISVTIPGIPSKAIYPLEGINFSPYMDGQDPNYGTFIPADQIRDRLRIIAPYVKRIRTFGVTDGLEVIPAIAHQEFGLDVAVGIWLGKDLTANEEQINNLINLIDPADILYIIVGSEVLLRGDLTESQLINYINRVKAAFPGIPVTYGEVYSILLSYPNIMNTCDFLFINTYSYWEGVDINNAVCKTVSDYQSVVSAAGGKRVVISEMGWPTCGDTNGGAVSNLTNAVLYFNSIISWAQADNVEYYYFEAFNESWKAAYEGPQGVCWGVWDEDGNMKSGMEDVFDGMTIAVDCSCSSVIGGPGTPEINFIYVPPIGNTTDYLKGNVLHVVSVDYKVVVYIRVNGGWWIKPTYAQPLTNINCDGTWSADIVTGGVDQNATDITVYLIPNGYNPPLLGGSSYLPQELDDNSVAKVTVAR